MTSKGTVAAIFEEKNGLTQVSGIPDNIFWEKVEKIHILLIIYAFLLEKNERHL